MPLNYYSVTVTAQVAVLPPAVAVIVAVPADTPVTTPAADTVATLSSLDVHATSVNVDGVTVAVSVSAAPTAMLAVVGATLIACTIASSGSVSGVCTLSKNSLTSASPSRSSITIPFARLPSEKRVTVLTPVYVSCWLLVSVPSFSVSLVSSGMLNDPLSLQT